MKTKRKYLYREQSKDGTEYYYFRKGRGRRIRIHGEPWSDQFVSNYKNAVLYHADDKSLLRDRITKIAFARLRNAIARDRSLGRLPTVDKQWIVTQLENNSYRCAVTKIEFSLAWSTGRINPFAPSIDRIDCSKGYTKDNCRLVIFAANMMMLDWGSDVFGFVAQEYCKNVLFPKNETHSRKEIFAYENQ